MKITKLQNKNKLHKYPDTPYSYPIVLGFKARKFLSSVALAMNLHVSYFISVIKAFNLKLSGKNSKPGIEFV